MNEMISFMMELQVEWDVGIGSLGAWVMCRCLDVFVKEVVAERVTTFVDGPLQTYKTVVYLQCVYNEAVASFFVASMCIIAPLEPMTVPRLELAGAVLGLYLTQHSTPEPGLPLQYVTVYPDIMNIL